MDNREELFSILLGICFLLVFNILILLISDFNMVIQTIILTPLVLIYFFIQLFTNICVILILCLVLFFIVYFKSVNVEYTKTDSIYNGIYSILAFSGILLIISGGILIFVSNIENPGEQHMNINSISNISIEDIKKLTIDRFSQGLSILGVGVAVLSLSVFQLTEIQKKREQYSTFNDINERLSSLDQKIDNLNVKLKEFIKGKNG